MYLLIEPCILSILTMRPIARTCRPYRTLFAFSCKRSVSVPVRPNINGWKVSAIGKWLSYYKVTPKHLACDPLIILPHIHFLTVRIFFFMYQDNEGCDITIYVIIIIIIIVCACISICLTLALLTWRIWWANTNASKWQMGFNSTFKGLIPIHLIYYCVDNPFESHTPFILLHGVTARKTWTCTNNAVRTWNLVNPDCIGFHSYTRKPDVCWFQQYGATVLFVDQFQYI